jgi:hypothetical protein
VGALKGNDVGDAGLAAIKRKILAHDFDRLGPAGLQIFGAVNRVPEQTHLTAAKGFRSRAVLFHEAVHIDSSSSEKRSG